jgi:hypothetical protein
MIIVMHGIYSIIYARFERKLVSETDGAQYQQILFLRV